MVESAVQSQAEIVVGSTEKAKIQVLHVDDEPALLKVAKECLKLHGTFEVDSAGSVEEALAKLERKSYEAVVSDYQMPGKDGLEFLDELRTGGNMIPFILFTGKGREEVAIKALNLGADQYLNKSGDPETVYRELAHSITRAVERERAEKRLKESEARYRHLCENAKALIITVDLKGKITFVNEIVKDYGFQKAEIIGKNMLNFVPKKYWPKLLKEHAQVARGKSTEGEVEINTPKGRITAEYKSTPTMLDGRVVGDQSVLTDITERKRMELALEQSEEKYRTQFEEAIDALFLADAETGIIVDYNRAATELVGRKKSELIGKHQRILHPPEEVEGEFSKTFKQHLKEKQGQTLETQVITENGEIKDVAIKANVFELEGKKLIRAIFRDITESKKAEHELRESETRYRMLVEQVPDAIYTISGEDGKITSLNPAFERITGWKPSEWIGKSFEKLIHPDDLPFAMEAFQKTMRGETLPPYELRVLSRSGEYLTGEFTSSPQVEKGRIVGKFGVVRDITDHKRIQEAIAGSQARFRALFVDNPEAGVFLNTDFHVVDVNPRFEKLFGYSLEEIKGRHINDVVVPDFKLKEAQELDSHSARGYAHCNTVRRRKDGSLVPVSISAAPITIEDQIVGSVGVYKDISELKNAQNKLEAMNEKLRVVGGLTRHDVRNKLSAVTGNIYINKKKLADRPDVLESFNDMQLACDQIVEIFEFARDYELLGSEELAFVDVEKMVEKAAGYFPDLKGARLVNECRGLTVLADSLLARLFYNLIDNSLKHGGKVAQIRIRHETSEDGLKLIYKDDGTGIPHNANPKLFKEGYTTGKGSGYGLYLIGRIMEAYGWTISETGAPDKGACFTMSMPRKNKEGKENFQLR